MKKIFLLLLVVLLAACHGTTADVNDASVNPECIGDNCEIVRYSTPNGNDLVLETAQHVIQIEAKPDVKYMYYVWGGDKTTDDEPDLIIKNGQPISPTEK
jgi:hypothetical protein